MVELASYRSINWSVGTVYHAEAEALKPKSSEAKTLSGEGPTQLSVLTKFG